MTPYNRMALTLVSALILSATPALAEDAGPGGPPPAGMDQPPPPEGDGPGGSPREEKFMKGDANQDGFLSKDEMEAEHQKRMNEMFTQADGDKDGRLSRDEMHKGREAMRAKMQERMKDRKGKFGGGEDGAGAGSGDGKRGEMMKRFKERRQNQSGGAAQ